MKQNHFFRKALVIACAAFLVVSCNKEENPVIVDNEASEVSMKLARDVTADDSRDWGTESEWIGSKALLNMLGPGQLPDKNPGLFVNVPKGILIKEESYLYVTIIGKAAAFNNALGYYYHTQGTGFTKDNFLAQVLESNNQKITLENIICSNTRNLGHGMTFELSMNGSPFPAGTVVGFCLYPYAGAPQQDASPVIKMQNGQPVFITTDWSLSGISNTSHITGQGPYGEYTFAFEDRNASFSATSDNDFNDLIFVVTDNLYGRTVFNITTYDETAVPFSYGHDRQEGCQDGVLLVKNFETDALYTKWENAVCDFTTFKLVGNIPLAENDYYMMKNRFGNTDIILDFSEYTFSNNIIPADAFNKNMHVILPKSIVTIGEWAFEGNQYMNTLDLPNLLEIGNHAFAGCKLASVNFPKVTTIGDMAFAGCITNTVVLPEAVTIGEMAFMSSEISTIDLPRVTMIGEQAFSASKVVTLKLEGAVEIGQEALVYCHDHIKTLVFGPDLKVINAYLFGNRTSPHWPLPQGLTITMKSAPPVLAGYVEFGTGVTMYVPQDQLAAYISGGWKNKVGKLIGY